MAEPFVESVEPTMDERRAALAARRAAQKKKMRPWLITAMVIVGLWALIASFSSQSTGGGIAYAIGHMIGSGLFTCLISSLVVGFFLWLLAGRRLQPSESGRHVGILLITAVVATAAMGAVKISLGAQRSADRAQLSQLLQDQLRLQEDMIAQAESATEDDELLARLEPAALARPGGIARAREAIDQLEQEMSRIDNEIGQASETFRSQAMLLIRTESDRAAFEEGVAQREAVDEEVLEVRRQNYAAHRRQLDILSRTPRRWQVQEGQIAFYDDQQLAEFQAASDEIHRTRMLEQQIFTKVSAAQQAAVRSLQ